jgi:hypothetical protein
MNLETLNTLAQFIAAIGVIGSLFYLAAQIRQNTRSMRAVVVDSLAKSMGDIARPLAEQPSLAEGFAVAVEDWHGATDEQRRRVLFLLFASFKLYENAWFQNQQGTLTPEQWAGWDALIRMYYHRPGVRTWWPMRSAAFAEGFRRYVETSEPVTGIAPISELIHGRENQS